MQIKKLPPGSGKNERKMQKAEAKWLRLEHYAFFS